MAVQAMTYHDMVAMVAIALVGIMHVMVAGWQTKGGRDLAMDAIVRLHGSHGHGRHDTCWLLPSIPARPVAIVPVHGSHGSRRHGHGSPGHTCHGSCQTDRWRSRRGNCNGGHRVSAW